MPPTRCTSSATYLPAGLRSARYGVRRMISTTSSMVKRMPASCAIAGRCRPALVEPPVAPATIAAFSSALRVTMSRGRSRLSSSAITARPNSTAKRSRSSYGAGEPAEPGSARPIASLTIAMVLAVNWPPQAPAEGQATHSSSCRSASRHPAGGVPADRLEHVDHGHVAAVEAAGQDRAAVHEHARHIQPQHRHHHAGQRLVAAGQPDQRVVAVAAHGQLHAVGDQVARDQRRLHALVAHGDAVGHRDGGELARRAAGLGDALLHRLRLAAERDVAGRRLVPAGGDADEGLVDLVLGQAHRVVVAAMRRAVRPHGHVAGRQLRLVPAPGQHGRFLPFVDPPGGYRVAAAHATANPDETGAGCASSSSPPVRRPPLFRRNPNATCWP